MTERSWVYWNDGEHGPFDAERVAALVREGVVHGRTDIRPADQPGWTPAQSLFPELFPATSAPDVSDGGSWADTSPHPWRRFAARVTDITVVGTIVALLIGVIGYIISPERTEAVASVLNSRAGQLVGIVLVLLIIIPFNALALGLSGLTLGKWIFGIRVLKHAKPIGVLGALRRELGVFAFGMGCGLPLISLGTTIYSFRRLSSGRAAPWDRDQDLTIVHRPESLKATIGMILAVFAVLLLRIAMQWASR